MKHTKGPWFVNKLVLGDEETAWFVVHQGNPDYPYCSPSLLQMNGPCLLYNNAEADAKLISAAPDLLEACKLALNAFENNWVIDWDQLRDAIEKAEGQ